MPLYEFECECGNTASILLSMKDDIPKTLECVPIFWECDKQMYRVFGFTTPRDSYDRPLISDALAMNPNQIAEHRRQFPDITVHPDGRPEFTSFEQHETYLKATGFQKNRQKIRPGTRKIYKKTVQTP